MNKKVKEICEVLTRKFFSTPGDTLFAIVAIAVLLWANRAGVLVIRAAEINAASTETIAYQGLLADSTGILLTGNYGMTFRLYSAELDSEPLWEEQWANVSVNDGLFNVLLGSVMPIPHSVVMENDTLYLGIEVNGDGEMTPRVQLGSVPYAMHALNVQTSGDDVPFGTIIMWSGALADIPDGWNLCDGTNGTPDLTDRFILSVPDSSTDPGDIGGNHRLDLQHTHRVQGRTGIETPTHHDIDEDDQRVADDEHRHSVDIVSQGASSTASPAVDFNAVDIRPAYYTLAFIMKD